MLIFTKIREDFRLYETCSQDGFTGLILGDDTPYTENTLTLTQAFSDSSLRAVFIFSPARPDFSSREKTDEFIQMIRASLLDSCQSRAVVWVSRENNSVSSLLPLSPDGSYTPASFVCPLCHGLSVRMPGNTPVALGKDESSLTFGQLWAKTVTFSGPMAPPEEDISGGDIAEIPFTGADPGTIHYSLGIIRRCLADTMNYGFQYLIPNTVTAESVPRPYVAQWFPFIDGTLPSSTDILDFSACILPGSPRRTKFSFENSSVTLHSHFLSPWGKNLVLIPVGRDCSHKESIPAGFVVDEGTVGNTKRMSFCLSPAGDYILKGDSGSDTGQIMCGLNPTEAILFSPDTGNGHGDRLRFIPHQNAYIPVFPPARSSAFSAPADPRADLLTSVFTTSYGTVIRCPGMPGAPHYIAQPEGARLYQKEESKKGLLFPSCPGVMLKQPPEELCFPMVPFSGFIPGDGISGMSSEQTEMLETRILAPARKKRIAQADCRTSSSPERSLVPHACGLADGPIPTVTPLGMLCLLDSSSGQPQKIQMAQGTVPGFEYTFSFQNPHSYIWQAVNTSRLCLIIANDKYLCVEGGSFSNEILLEGWGIKANPGTNEGYGRYKNIMIFKSCPGKLAELVCHPEQWTMPGEFAAPSTVKPDGTASEPELSQLTAVSQWLQEYFADSMKQEPVYYGRFQNLIQDESWNGFLVLKADISRIPESLSGILSGIEDKADFYAHHLAVNLSAIDGDSVTQKGTSSVYGLIDYTDSSYHGVTDESPVPEENGDYAFRVLKLRTIFENSEIKDFYSLAQLTLNRLFDSPVTRMGAQGNPCNAVMMHGTYQRNGDSAVMRLEASRAGLFCLDNNVLSSVCVTEALLSNSSDAETNGDASTEIMLSGHMLFQIPTYEKEDEGQYPLDLFSFGNPPGSAEGCQGLPFENLRLRILKKADGETSYSLDTDSMRFKTASDDCQVRPGSLYQQFALTLSGILYSDGEKLPADMGYLPLATDCSFSSFTKKSWYGLCFCLGMGTPGSLASRLPLNSELLLAWSSSSAGERMTVFAGLKLPGASKGSKEFSLQNILKLSVGTLRLVRDTKKKAFLLLMSDISLKFLGIKALPPEGSTCFYLFGPPQETESADGLGWYAAYNREPGK